MRRVLILSVIVEIALISIQLGCNSIKSNNGDNGGSDSNGSDDLTPCGQAVQEWSQIWTVKTEETGLIGDTPENNLMDIWGSGPEDIYVVGFKGIILHFDGTTWTKMDSGTSENLRGVWGYVLKDQNGSPLKKELFAVGDNGTIRRYNGSDWYGQNVYFTDLANGNSMSAVTDDINDVWGIPPATQDGEPMVIAVGADGLIVRYDEISKTFQETRQLVMIEHTPPDPATPAYHRWTQEQLNGVFGEYTGSFSAVGNTGTVLEVSVSGTTVNATPVTFIPTLSTHLNGVWGRGDELYAVGNEGKVVRRRSGSWSNLNLGLPPTFLRSSWSFSQDSCGPMPEGGTEANRPTTSWRIYVGWEGTLLLEHDDLVCPLDSITGNRLEAVWGTPPRSLAERTTTTTDANGAPVTTWVCDPVEILIAGVKGTLIRLSNREGR
jgi:hypothetical protein